MAFPTFAAADLLSADDASLLSAFGPPRWGIFTQDGDAVLVADAVASIQYARDYQISDYPQEKGAFESYNKVQQPYQARIGYYIAESRAEFLNTIEDAVQSLDLVYINTPEIEYPSANLTHYDYRREVRNGVTLILVNVWCEEVRVVQPTTETTPQSTNGATPTQSGQVQATASGEATAGAGASTDYYTSASPSRQEAIKSEGQQLGAKTAYVGAPDASGNQKVIYITSEFQ